MPETGCLLIANPTAGRGAAKGKVDELQGILRRLGVRHELTLTRSEGDATGIARKAAAAGWPLVVAVGGDGTMWEVLNGVAGTPSALGIVPTGTGNDMARSLGIPLNLAGAARVLAAENHELRPVDVGEDPDGKFGIVLGLNFPSEVMRYVNTGAGPFRGSLAITAGVVRTVTRLRAERMRLELDGKALEADVAGLFIMNTPYTGGGLFMAPEAHPDDGWLDVVILGRIGRLDLLRTLPRAYKGTHVTHPSVSITRCQRISVETDRPLDKLFDGNVHGKSPVRAQVAHHALRVAVPRRGGGDAATGPAAGAAAGSGGKRGTGGGKP